MANMLAWLTGREDRMGQPSPVQYDTGPSLRAYDPTPSERVGSWIQDALMGMGASPYPAGHIAHGLRDILQATPLGIGMSAADFAHAKAAGDPMGAAAAAIGLIPAVGPEARAGVQALKKADPVAAMYSFYDKEIANKIGASNAKAAAAAAKPSFDYEKDDTGLYHIFDAMSGKTHAVVNTPNEAKGWIAKQTGKPADFNPDETIPKSFGGAGSPNTVKTPDLLEAQKKYEAAIAPLAQNLPERAQAQGYTTSAFRGMKIRSGDVNPVYKYGDGTTDVHYSTGNPMLADMYSDYASKHPGWHAPSDAYGEGATVSSLLLDTSKYHYYDAGGAHWSSSAGNMRGITQAREKGAPGVIVDNVWDEPNSTHALGTPSKIYITFPEGATTVKSRFAQKFDPSDPNMLHGLAGLGAGGAATAALFGGDQAQAAQRPQMVQPQSVTDKINEIMNGLDWQDQWMARMRLPLDNYASKLRSQK